VEKMRINIYSKKALTFVSSSDRLQLLIIINTVLKEQRCPKEHTNRRKEKDKKLTDFVKE
jgi:hypothetical protein